MRDAQQHAVVVPEVANGQRTGWLPPMGWLQLAQWAVGGSVQRQKHVVEGCVEGLI